MMHQMRQHVQPLGSIERISRRIRRAYAANMNRVAVKSDPFYESTPQSQREHAEA